MAHPVKWFRSTQASAPDLGDTVDGDFNAWLKTLLIDGFNITAPTTATYDVPSDRVTLTFGSAHGYEDYQVIEVSGANEGAFNGQFRVLSSDELTLTFKPDSTPPGAATGTLACKAAPVGGWEVADEDLVTHRLALRRTHIDATDYVLVIENESSQRYVANNYPWVALVEMVDNFVDLDQYDVVSSYVWPASMVFNTRDKSWFFAGDHLMFLFNIGYGLGNSGGRKATYLWGDINSIIPGDRGHCAFVFTWYSLTDSSWDWNSTSTEQLYNYFHKNENASYRMMATAYHGLPGQTGWWTTGWNTDSWGARLGAPNPANNALMLSTQPMAILESTDRGNSLRGFMPGLVEPLMGMSGLNKQIITGVPGYPDDTPMICVYGAYSRGSDTGENPVWVRLDQWREQVG